MYSPKEYEASKRDWELQRYEDASLMLYQLGISPKKEKRKRRSKGSKMGIDPEKLDPRAAARGKTKPALLPRVSYLACNPAPTITVHAVWQSAKVIVRVQPSWEELCELITQELNLEAIANIPYVSKLYKSNDEEVHCKEDLEDGESYFTMPKAVLEKKRRNQGLSRTLLKLNAAETQTKWTNPLESPLISPEGYKNLTKGADKRMLAVNPKKLIVRANRWTEHVEPPSHFVQHMLVKGTLDILMADVTDALHMDKACQVLFHPDGRRVRSCEELQDGQTIYTLPKDVSNFSKRDWGITLCPPKAHLVIAHSNRWSEAPAPSRYAKQIVVPSSLKLLSEVITDMLKTDNPVRDVFQVNGDRITDIDQVEDLTHIYIDPHPDRMKPKEVNVDHLAPDPRKLLRIHKNYFEGDQGSVVTVCPMNPKLADGATQWIILMEECTLLLGMSVLCRKLWNLHGEEMPQDTKALVPGAEYYTYPPPCTPRSNIEI